MASVVNQALVSDPTIWPTPVPLTSCGLCRIESGHVFRVLHICTNGKLHQCWTDAHMWSAMDSDRIVESFPLTKLTGNVLLRSSSNGTKKWKTVLKISFYSRTTLVVTWRREVKRCDDESTCEINNYNFDQSMCSLTAVRSTAGIRVAVHWLF